MTNRRAFGPTRHAYGTGPDRFGELTRPAGGHDPLGTVVLVHGGFWRAQYTLSLGRPLASDLARRGYVAWNLEYRRVGNGGGWPTTFADVADGIDHLATLGVDTEHVALVGHSAGGHLATWAAGRAVVPADAPGAPPRVTPTGVVSQAGVLALAQAAHEGVGATAVPDLLGGSPRQVPARYALADPLARVPLQVPVRCIHAHADANVPYSQSRTYVEAASRAGADAALITVPGDHFTLIDPSTPAWQAVIDVLPGLLG